MLQRIRVLLTPLFDTDAQVDQAMAYLEAGDWSDAIAYIRAKMNERQAALEAASLVLKMVVTVN
jgi:hypothetical protein